jgi:hemerythrin-like metal-binding protein
MFKQEIEILKSLDINQQHHELVNKIYNLRDAVKDVESLESIERVIDDVISYTRFHHEYEEGVMDRYGYPVLKWHKGQLLLNPSVARSKEPLGSFVCVDQLCSASATVG